MIECRTRLNFKIFGFIIRKFQKKLEDGTVDKDKEANVITQNNKILSY